MVDAGFVEALPQHGKDRSVPCGIEPPGQCHVKAKLLEHVRISPAVEMIALPWRQPCWIAPGTIFVRKRRAEGVEFADAVGGEAFERSLAGGRHDRDEALDRI